MEKRIALDEEVGEQQRRFVRNLLKDSDLPLGKIALVVDVSQETVRKITVLSIIEELVEIKRKEVLKECRASEYCEDYSFGFVRDYLRGYKVGLQDGNNGFAAPGANRGLGNGS